MAILRGGKRIGGIDVRIGIPRDRSLDNITGDPRLKRTQGGNPETTLGRFQSYVNEAEGFATASAASSISRRRRSFSSSRRSVVPCMHATLAAR